MEIPNPSSDWTPEERLEVIAALMKPIHPPRPYPLRETVLHIATASAEFLETNREQILEYIEE